jgi:putative two-component system response regulator
MTGTVTSLNFPRPLIEDARVLIVDDSPPNVLLINTILERAGFTSVLCSNDPREALRIIEAQSLDLILLDLHMPHLSGIEVMDRMRDLLGPDVYLPVLMITADVGREVKEEALSRGVNDFLHKPFDQTEVVLRVRNLLETRLLHVQLQKHNEILEQAVADRTEALWRAIARLERAQTDLESSQEETINRLSMAAEYRDEATGAHIQRVSRYCALLARRVGAREEEAEVVRLAAQMHDIGKIAIPDRILLKPGALELEERALMESHAEIGYRLLRDSDSEMLRLAASIAHSHHERVDGNGYPKGLEGDAIALEGRIAAIADVFDALTTDRVYRDAWPIDRALEEMEAGRGTHFDPGLLDEFVEAIPEALPIKDEFLDVTAVAKSRYLTG